jgi:hypothetical protein
MIDELVGAVLQKSFDWKKFPKRWNRKQKPSYEHSTAVNEIMASFWA